jgi:hypothetical protein
LNPSENHEAPQRQPGFAWRRPMDEVNFLMGLFELMLRQELHAIHEKGVKQHRKRGRAKLCPFRFPRNGIIILHLLRLN